MFRQPNVVGDGTTRRGGAVSRETCAESGERRRSQSLHSTGSGESRERRGKQNRAEGREIGRWTREFHNEAGRKPSAGSAREGYTRCRDTWPGLVVGGSFGVE